MKLDCPRHQCQSYLPALSWDWRDVHHEDTTSSRDVDHFIRHAVIWWDCHIVVLMKWCHFWLFESDCENIQSGSTSEDVNVV